MSALTTCLIGWAAFSPTLAPVPAEPAPNPTVKPAIGVQADTNTCVVSVVYPAMPAGKAGVRPGDRIVRVGMIHPADFSQVVNHVTSYRPGAVIEMEVERGGERKVFKMKLIPRPSDFDNPNRVPVPVPFLPDE